MLTTLSLLLVFVLPLLGAVLWRRRVRLDRRTLTMGAMMWAACLALVSVAPHGPANWYGDFAGPSGGLDALRRPAGVSQLYRLLNDLFPVGPWLVFGVNAVARATAVGLIVLAIGARRDRGWPAHTGWLLGLSLSVEPLGLVIGASDAAANLAFLAWATCFALHAIPPADDDRLQDLVRYVAAAVPGAIRPDYALSVVAIPLLLPRREGESRRSALRGVAAIVAGGAMGGALWIGQDMGVRITVPDAERVGRWVASLLAALLGRPYGRLDGVQAGFQPWLLLGLSLFALGAMLTRRNRLVLGPLLGVLALGLPRLFTDFHGNPVGSNVTNGRYGLVVLALLAVLPAAGASELIALARRRLPPRRAPGVPHVLAGALVGAAWISWATPPGQERPLDAQPHRLEYRFLRENLDRLPRGARIQTHWFQHWAGERGVIADPDAGLRPGHALLSFERSDLTWVVLGPGDALEACPTCFYYRGAICSLDPAPLIEADQPAAATHLDRTLDACLRASARVEPWLATAEVEATPLAWPIREGRLHLAIGAVRETDAARP